MDQRRKLGRPRQALVGEAVDQQDQPTCSNVFVVQVAARRLQNYHLLRPAWMRQPNRRFFCFDPVECSDEDMGRSINVTMRLFPADHFVI
jgi:hypothetical protein